MTSPSLGNVLFRLVTGARHALFNQGELAQLTYSAFDVVVGNVRNSADDVFEFAVPVGYRPDRTTIPSTKQYTKDDLLGRYQFLALHQLPANGIAQLVTIIEALLADVLRSVVARYPQKLGVKRTLSLQSVLESQTLEEVHLKATDSLLNELSYKSPADFSDALHSLLSFNLLECPAFHKYIEFKATRDIHVHNRGIANETYLKKSGSHARASRGMFLPIDISYFLESYEACLQITEWLEVQLDQNWQSSEREVAQAQPIPPPLVDLPTGPTEAVPPAAESQVVPPTVVTTKKPKQPRKARAGGREDV